MDLADILLGLEGVRQSRPVSHSVITSTGFLVQLVRVGSAGDDGILKEFVSFSRIILNVLTSVQRDRLDCLLPSPSNIRWTKPSLPPPTQSSSICIFYFLPLAKGIYIDYRNISKHCISGAYLSHIQVMTRR